MPNQKPSLTRSVIEQMGPDELNARWNEVLEWMQMQANATQPVKQPWVDHGGDLTRDDLVLMDEETMIETMIQQFPRVQAALTRLGTQNNDK